MIHRATVVIAASVLIVSICGCNAVGNIPESGHYEGTLIELQGQQLLSQAIGADIPAIKDGAALIQILPETGTDLMPTPQAIAPLSLRLSDISPESMTISLNGVLPDPIALKKIDTCFQSTDSTVRFCPDSRSLTLEMNDSKGNPLFSLSLDSFGSSASPKLETPQAFTLDTLMQRAFTMEFNTRMEFQRVMQARYLAKQGYLNLLPHLSTNSILALASGGPVIGLLGSIGDLAPFLLPSRWFQAQESADLSDAEHDALSLMRGDAGVQAEGLAYADARDHQIANLYQAALAQVDDILAKVRQGESSGQFPPGTADQIETIRIEMDGDADGLDLSIREQRTYLAQALGFINPDAITDVSVPDPITPIENATVLDEKNFEEAVLSRAYELRQMDSLIRAAQAEKQETLFSWMDPTGDPTLGLGFGLTGAMSVDQSEVDELMVAREQQQSIILQTLATTIDEYNDSMDDHERSVQQLTLQEERLNREVQALNSGGQVDILDLVTALPAHLAAQLDVKNAETVYRLMTARLNRLLLNGYYAKIGWDAPKSQAFSAVELQ